MSLCLFVSIIVILSSVQRLKELLVKTLSDVLNECLQPFSRYTVPKILKEWKGFQPVSAKSKIKNWLEILDFTLLLFMWLKKNTAQLSQLHSHVHVTVNVSTHCSPQPPSLQQLKVTILNTCISETGLNCSFVPFIMVGNEHIHFTDVPNVCSYLY